jgi:anti-sigma factor RsiW
MNCQQVRPQLAELLYGDVAPLEKTDVEKHLAYCAECSSEYRALANVRRLLDLPKAPASGAGLPGVYRLLAERQAERMRRWRRVALALAGVAALLAIFALGVRFEARMEQGQLVLRWGPVPKRALEQQPDSPASGPSERPAEPVSVRALEDQLHTVSKILHALADDLRELERREQLNTADLHARLKEVQEHSLRRLAALERNVEALYVTSQKGE